MKTTDIVSISVIANDTQGAIPPSTTNVKDGTYRIQVLSTASRDDDGAASGTLMSEVTYRFSEIRSFRNDLLKSIQKSSSDSMCPIVTRDVASVLQYGFPSRKVFSSQKSTAVVAERVPKIQRVLETCVTLHSSCENQECCVLGSAVVNFLAPPASERRAFVPVVSPPLTQLRDNRIESSTMAFQSVSTPKKLKSSVSSVSRASTVSTAFSNTSSTSSEQQARAQVVSEMIDDLPAAFANRLLMYQNHM